MVTNAHELKALVRLAIWARFAMPVPGRRKWRGFDSQETSRLMELAAAVDRNTLARFVGIIVVLTLCSSTILAALMIIALGLLRPPLPPSFSYIGWSIMMGAGIGATIAMLAAYRVAADVAVRLSLFETLTVRAGDAELVVTAPEFLGRGRIGYFCRGDNGRIFHVRGAT